MSKQSRKTIQNLQDREYLDVDDLAALCRARREEREVCTVVSSRQSDLTAPGDYRLVIDHHIHTHGGCYAYVESARFWRNRDGAVEMYDWSTTYLVGGPDVTVEQARLACEEWLLTLSASGGDPNGERVR